VREIWIIMNGIYRQTPEDLTKQQYTETWYFIYFVYVRLEIFYICFYILMTMKLQKIL
jgi:hypothetical protein